MLHSYTHENIRKPEALHGLCISKQESNDTFIFPGIHVYSRNYVIVTELTRFFYLFNRKFFRWTIKVPLFRSEFYLQLTLPKLIQSNLESRFMNTFKLHSRIQSGSPACAGLQVVTQSWYRTHTVPKLLTLSSWITGACHYTRLKNGNIRTICGICSKLIIKTDVNDIALMFLLLALNRFQTLWWQVAWRKY